VDRHGAQWGEGAVQAPLCITMEANETVARTYYNSLYRHGVDGKRRIQVPAKWRPAKSGTELTLVLWPKPKEGPCLRVLPPTKMADLMRDIDAMPNSDPNKVVLKRFIGSESVQVALDKVGRICLPEEMAKAAGITVEAILVGLLDRFEIWNPERYENVKTADALMAQEAFKLME
jgi:transcriptional regulator MraZ